MEEDCDGDTLNKHQEEQLRKTIATMNVFSEHKKIMAEFTSPIKKVKKIKKNKL